MTTREIYYHNLLVTELLYGKKNREIAIKLTLCDINSEEVENENTEKSTLTVE